MRRPVLVSAALAATAAVAACGGASAGTATPSATARGGAGFGRNGAAGQLVQLSASTLVLSNANGDTTVTYTPSTTITQTSTGSFADIVAGVCLTATGTKDATGQITAAVVQVSPAVNGACPRAGLRGGGARRSPSPSFSPNPEFANRAVARGIVAGVSGTLVTLRTTSGSTDTVTVPTTVRVTTSSSASASALQTGQCILAVGQRSSSGAVAARSLTIVPAGPSGCFSNGGGFGGFGGGFGGGAFGGGSFGA